VRNNGGRMRIWNNMIVRKQNDQRRDREERGDRSATRSSTASCSGRGGSSESGGNGACIWFSCERREEERDRGRRTRRASCRPRGSPLAVVGCGRCSSSVAVPTCSNRAKRQRPSNREGEAKQTYINDPHSSTRIIPSASYPRRPIAPPRPSRDPSRSCP
jgi:hypothetical protein